MGTAVASPGTMTPVTRTTTKKVTFAQPLVEPKNKNKGDPKGKAEAGLSKINQPTPKRKPTSRVKKEVNAIDRGGRCRPGGICTVPKYRAAVDYTPRLRAPRNLPRCTANSETYRQ